MSRSSRDVLLAARQRCPSPFAAESAEEHAALQRFRNFFSRMTPDSVATLCRETYADDVWFNDTLKSVEGLQALQHYLADSAAAVQECSVDIHDIVRSSNADYLVQWSMRIRFKRFKPGIATDSIGMSHLRFDSDGRILYHQDYWDSGSGLFAHVPLLGWAIARIKARL